DRPDHDELGRYRCRHDVYAQLDELLRAALSAGGGGSRLLPRHDPLSDLLVHPCGAGADGGTVYDRHGDLQRDWRSLVRRSAEYEGDRRAAGMAVAVPAGGTA